MPHEKIDIDFELPDYCEAINSRGLVRLSYRGVPIVAVFAYAGSEAE